jgi:hypothetical protein
MSKQDPSLGPLESALANLKPAPTALDRDRLMFRAGQLSTRWHWVWPASTAALFVMSLALAGVLAFRPTAPESVRVVYVPIETSPPVSSPRQPVPAPTPATSTADVPAPPASAPYLSLRGQVLRFGVESLPDPPPLATETPAPSVDRLFAHPKSRPEL